MIISIKDAIDDIRNGKLLIVVDDKSRENEGDFFAPSETLTPDKVTFMATIGRGLICVSIPENQLNKLKIPPMTVENPGWHQCRFYASCDAKLPSISTGISAYDRCATMKLLVDNNSKNSDFSFPGHVFPLCPRDNGVLDRDGHTEASADLSAISGLKPSGAIVEIMKDNGEMARLPDLEKISEKHKINIVTIKDLVNYRYEQGLTTSLYKGFK